MATRQRTVTKRSVLKSLKELPERFDVDDLIERIVLLQKVEEGITDARSGRVHTLAEMRSHIERKWSK